jgi:protein SCO1/2
MKTRWSFWQLFLLPAALINASSLQARPNTDDLITSIVTGLVDQANRPVTGARFAGRYVLVNFIFTGCGSTCPTQTADLARFERSLPAALRRQVTLLSISVDPANDTPRQLRTYARAFGVEGQRWTFATGPITDIQRITRDFSALKPGQTATAMHTSEVYLFDRRHRMIQRYNGAPLAARQLRGDLIALGTART